MDVSKVDVKGFPIAGQVRALFVITKLRDPLKAPEATTAMNHRSHKTLKGMRPSSLSGPLNGLNAILSLVQPLDRYRGPSAIESAIGRPYLALTRMKMQVGVLNRLVRNRAAIVSKTFLKQARKKTQ